MNARALYPSFLCGAIVLSVVTAPMPGYAQSVSPIPAAPMPPKILPFRDEAAGRRLWFAARDALTESPTIGFTARFTLTVVKGNNAPTVVQTATETLKSEANTKRLAFTTELVQGKEKRTHRAIAAENNLLVTRYQDRGDGKTTPIREFVRIPMDDTTNLPRLLRAASIPLMTAGSQILFQPESPDQRGATLWQGRDVTEKGTRYEAVLETIPTTDTSRPTTRIRRYLLQPGTHRLLRFEEWATSRERPRPTRKGVPANDNVLLAYRREEYSGYSMPKAFPATVFTQTLPASYTEKPLPDIRAAEIARVPEDADPRALALLKKWAKVQERYLSLNTDIEQKVQMAPRTAESAPIPDAFRNYTVRYAVQSRRLGQTRLTQDIVLTGNTQPTSGGRGGYRALMMSGMGGALGSRSILAVSDGKMLRTVDRTNGSTRSRDLRSPAELWGRIVQSGISDSGGVLEWIYQGAPDPTDFTRIAYEGRTILENGEPVEIIVLEQKRETDSGGGRRGSELVTRIERYRVALGRDGLPRQIETLRRTDINGTLERDQPPIVTLVSRYRNVLMDTAPSVTAFVLPLEKKTATK